jgi:hypothetical protein
MTTKGVALLVDWANAKAADFRKVVHLAQTLGNLEFAAAYGAWGRLETRNDEKLFLALGVDMVHCPRWPVGKNPDGTTKFKCTDDSVLHRDLMRLLWTRPDIQHFILAGADTDSLASACLAGQQNKEVVVMYNAEDGSLGHVMRLGNFRFEELPLDREANQSITVKGTQDLEDRVAFEQLPSLLVNEARRNHNGNGVKLVA